MSYPKEKLTDADPAGWYECDGFFVGGPECCVRRWDGSDVWDGDSECDEDEYINFRPLSLTPAAPEVVEGPAELPTGTWFVKNATATYTVDEFQTGAHRLITHEQRAFRIPDAWLAVLKAKPAPVVTDKHREAARKLRESVEVDGISEDGLALFFAKHFPAEGAK